jgi:hypothetical protein
VTTKKTPYFGRFAKQNKKALQVRSTPSRKNEKESLTLHNIWEKKYYFNTSTFMNCDQK